MLTAVAMFAAATAIVLLVAPRMARTADSLATATRMGGGLFGVIFVSVATDLPEMTLTPTAVLAGRPGIAIGSLLGSAAAQLVLIGVLDIAFRTTALYRRVPLLQSFGQCALMLAVLAVPLMVAAGTPMVAGVGVGTVLLPVVYLGALRAIRRIGRDPSAAGRANGTGESATASDSHSVPSLWLRFAGFALLLAGAGVGLEQATETIGLRFGIGETAAGALLAGIVTSLPELMTAISAVRLGALDLAVGDVIGSSALDVALLSWADVFHTDGSLFELLGGAEYTLIGVMLAITSLFAIGLARREVAGSRRVGVESYLMVAVYAAGAVILVITSGTHG